MSIVTAKAFRQQIMKPAEGLFLFHARAIERLIEGQLGERLAGVSVPNLPYYLMPRADFLLGLETENAEALSVIEGLDLPAYVILLPSPPDQRLEERSFTRLRHDYWARAFEAEVARTWQGQRECQHDRARFGAVSLRAIIGAHAFAEVREVLERDGMILPVWDGDLICRSFVAFVVRLRYFAPGARGFFFPAIRVWPEVDRWMVAGGLDLPRPLVDQRLPRLLLKRRPSSGGQLPTEVPLLPVALPYGRSDPDLERVVELIERSTPADAERPQPAAGGAEPAGTLPARSPAEAGGTQVLEERCLRAFSHSARRQPRPTWLERTGDRLGVARTQLLSALHWIPSRLLQPRWLWHRRDDERRRRRPEQTATLALFAQAVASAERAFDGGYHALALRRLAAARRVALRVFADTRRLPERVEGAITEREQRVEAALVEGLSRRWSLPAEAAGELDVLVNRLALDDRARDGAPAAQGLLGCLEQLLLQGPSEFYRLRFGRWLLSLGSARLRERLPFHSSLKALRALETARARLEELPWPLGDLERFSALLKVLQRQVTDRLEAELTPRIEQAMHEADFVPRNHRERVAAHKMRLELLDVIKQRRHLKFTDVRDIVARNILRLPDPTWGEFLRGDRLRRFDRTAARALPGVYRPGEFYIKGLQQLGAPLFGTPLGRDLLRHLLLPFGGAYVLLKTTDMLIHLIPQVEKAFHLTEPTSVVAVGALVNLFAYTGIGRHLGRSVLFGLWDMLRFVFVEGPRALVRWWPIAGLLSTGLVRGLGRNLIQPLVIGTVPLAPIIALAVLVDEVPIQPGLWLLGLAFALGTLARNTPGGRRFLDDLSTRVATYLQRINQALFLGLIQQLLFFFKEVTRRFSQLLHRVDDALTHHLGERLPSLAAKVVLAPLWRFSETVIQFYVTVLVEPQVNPVKHFPIVSIGHKILLPFLPAITSAFIEISDSVLPKVIAYPLVTLTIVLLPGLFGFLVWELKENWKLYEANHRERLRPVAGDGESAPLVEPAGVGSHGETMRGLMCRGFHSGTLPKRFDRLRGVIRSQLRDDEASPQRLRRCQRQLEELEHAICVFVDREFSFALRERCRDPDCTLTRVETNVPRLATELVEIRVAIHPRADGSAGPAAGGQEESQDPVLLGIRISFDGRRLCFETELDGASQRIGPRCWGMISEDLTLFAGRAGAELRGLELRLPETAARADGSPGGCRSADEVLRPAARSSGTAARLPSATASV